ncbi:uncharacterized protein LOC112000147 [Quercus suber]|uniref:uncharacterized protein LOC112000147 n=1 Tax=Quercus suber TaxID=58331 RepID=UPI0032DED4AA
MKGIHVEELEHETVHKDLIDSVVKELHESFENDNITDEFPKNYGTCIQFYQMLQNMARLAFGSKIMNCKGRKADEESASERDIIGQSQKGYQAQSKVQKHHFFRSRYAVCFNIFHLLYPIFIRIILGLGYEGIRTMKRKHVHSAQIVEILIEETAKKETAREYFISFKTLWQTVKGQSSLTYSDWITVFKHEQVEKKSEQGEFTILLH